MQFLGDFEKKNQKKDGNRVRYNKLAVKVDFCGNAVECHKIVVVGWYMDK